MNSNAVEEPSEKIRERVIAARQIQAKRYKNESILTNAELSAKLVKKYCKLDKASEEILRVAVVKYQLSGRRYDRILKLVRTIADLDNSEAIVQKHLMEALQYRMFENG